MMRYACNQYSQNGEDGIVAEIKRRIGVVYPCTFVEFGTGNGRDLSNTLHLADAGCSGVWIEQNEESYHKMMALAATFDGRVEGLHGTVGFGADDNLDAFLSRTRSPRDVDVLSIDVDSYDLQIWEACRDYRSKIVIIEINSGIPLGVRQVHGDGKQGASFTSMLELGEAKGYRLTCHTGNLIFVDAPLINKLGMPQGEIDDPNALFNDMWARWAAGK